MRADVSATVELIVFAVALFACAAFGFFVADCYESKPPPLPPATDAEIERYDIHNDPLPEPE